MKLNRAAGIFFFVILLIIPLASADLDPNRIMGYARIDGSWAPAGTLINITAGGATVQVTVDDGINVVPAEFGQGQFETDPDVPYWDTGDSYLVKDGTGYYFGQLTGTLIPGTTNVGILDLYAFVPAPEIDAQLNIDNKSVNLNWTNISQATSYTLYYSTNLTALELLNLSSIPSNVYNISGITTNKYNDTSAASVKIRYYRVAAVRGSLQNLSTNAVAKYTHTLIASSDGVLGRNLVAEPIQADLNSKTYLEAIPGSYDPYISKLDRSNPEQETWVPQVPEQVDIKFNLTQSGGYLAFVNKTFNYTFVGRTWTNLTTNYLIASSDGILGRNLIGVPYSMINYTSKNYVAGIPLAYDPYISKLDRSNPEQETWVPQVPEMVNVAFDILEGEGYLTFVNTSYNYSLS